MITPKPADVGYPETSVTSTEPSDRGRTVIADKVVEAIAAAASTEVARVTGLARQVAGRRISTPTVRAHAEVDGTSVALRLELAVDYRSPVRTVTRAVRQHVNEELRRQCAMDVDHIDITVAVLRRTDTTRRRVQ